MNPVFMFLIRPTVDACCLECPKNCPLSDHGTQRGIFFLSCRVACKTYMVNPQT